MAIKNHFVSIVGDDKRRGRAEDREEEEEEEACYSFSFAKQMF